MIIYLIWHMKEEGRDFFMDITCEKLLKAVDSEEKAIAYMESIGHKKVDRERNMLIIDEGTITCPNGCINKYIDYLSYSPIEVE